MADRSQPRWYVFDPPLRLVYYDTSQTFQAFNVIPDDMAVELSSTVSQLALSFLFVVQNYSPMTV